MCKRNGRRNGGDRMTRDDCDHDSCSFVPPIEIAWCDEDDVEGDIQVQVKCNDCGETLNAYYDFNSVSA